MNKKIESLLDPKFYLENFTKIKGKTPGLIPFILNEAQKDLFNTLRKHNRIIINKARQLGFCGHPDTRVLTSDLKWVTLREITEGQEIVSVDEFPKKKRRGFGRKMRTAIVEKKCFVFEDSFEIMMSDGRKLIFTGQHRFLSKKNGSTETFWKKVEDFKEGNEIRYITIPWEDGIFEDGWFGGMIDGEGSLRFKNHSGVEVCVAQCASPLFDKMLEYAKKNNFSFTIESDDRKNSDGNTSKFGNRIVKKVVFSRIDELFNLLGKTRPKRFIGIKWWEGKEMPGKRSGIGWSKIVSIKFLGKQKMIDIQTSTKTFIAEGFVSHNSTAISGYFYHKTITTPGTTTALIAHKAEVAAEFLDKIKTFWRTTPESLRPQLHYNSKYEISFPSLDSKIMVMSGDAVGRGFTIHLALCSELAQWEKAQEMMLALENAVPSTGTIVIESTPYGIGDLYHRMWMAKDNGYEKKQYGWWWGYSQSEIDQIKKRINDPMKFAQEYELEFLSSGRPVFAPDLIKRLRETVLEIGTAIKLEDGTTHFVNETSDGLRIYKPPVKGKIYVVGADPAEGVVGGDYSTATIYDRKTGEEVAFYRGHIQADKFGILLNRWGRWYNDALMVVEIQNHGLTTVTTLRNLMYPSLYFRPTKFDTMGTNWSDRIGWKTTKVTRPLMIDDFNEALREGSLIIHTKETVDEMTTFVFNVANNMIAMRGFHDDCIFASAIGFQGFKVLYEGELGQINYLDHLPRSTSY